MKNMSFVLFGLGISSGIAIGRAVLMNQTPLEVSRKNIPPELVETEISRFDKAIENVRKEFLQLQNNSKQDQSQNAKNKSKKFVELSAFLNVHMMFLEDYEIVQKPKDIIREKLCNAEWALIQQMNFLVQQFDSFEDNYFKDRKFDIIQVVERIVKELLSIKQNNHQHHHKNNKNNQSQNHSQEQNQSKNQNNKFPEIIVAHDISPADAMEFRQQQKNYAAFLTDVGGLTSHTAILARNMEIPAVLSLKNAQTLIKPNQLLIVDGLRGIVIVNPSPQILDEYNLRKKQLALKKDYLKKRLKSAKSQTLDGVDINLYANIELPSDAKNALEDGADGIGLFRSECLFLNSSGNSNSNSNNNNNNNNNEKIFNEDEQFFAYKSVAETMKNKPVVIRTLDIGADKVLPMFKNTNTSALGLRGIRLSLKEQHIFNTQIRAILRASAFGNIKILLPLLTNSQEIDQALNLINQQKDFLRSSKIAFDENIQIGGMIEVPAAALAVGFVLRRLDFISIGTNDLIQYTLAIDRADENVADLYDVLHPSVLILLYHTISSANKVNIPVSVCGEMASDSRMTKLLLGMGLRNFSMQSSQILKMKENLCKFNVSEITPIVKRIMKLDESNKIREALTKLNEN